MKPAWCSSAELHHAGFINYNLHDARNHENQIQSKSVSLLNWAPHHKGI